MSVAEDDFMSELQEGFLLEAKDLLVKVENLSLQIEKNDRDEAAFQELARLAHNLKGSGKAVGFDEISRLAHYAEDYILGLRNKRIQSNRDNLDLLFQCLDILRIDIDRLISDREILLNYDDQCFKLKSVLADEVKKIEGPSSEPASEGTVIQFTQEMDVHTPVEETQKFGATGKQTGKSTNESIRIPKHKLDYILDAFGEQVILQSTLEQCKLNVQKNEDLLIKTISLLSKHTLEMQKQVLSLTMVNLLPLFMKLERAVRDAANMCDKKIQVHFLGSDTEADKSLVDSLSDALTHMIRNAVDHGIESSEERANLEKSPVGNIYVEAKRVGGQIWIDILDDGKGMDPNVIRRKAIEKNIIDKDIASKMTEQEIFKLIFSNGFSTKETTSEISGRGVGMNVVEEVVTSLNGVISIDSHLGKGTCFRLKLPLSLAIFNGAVVRISESRFVVPTSEISEILRFNTKDLVSYGGSKFCIQVREEIYEIYDLRTIIGRNKCSLSPSVDSTFHVLLNNKGKKKAFVVDEILGIQKIVQKPIGDELKSQPGFVAATILSDGCPGVVLSVHQFQKAS